MTNAADEPKPASRSQFMCRLHEYVSVVSVQALPGNETDSASSMVCTVYSKIRKTLKRSIG
jgi:hypothetical protein